MYQKRMHATHWIEWKEDALVTFIFMEERGVNVQCVVFYLYAVL